MLEIDKFLNGITMYKLLLYGLFIMTFVAEIFAYFGFLPGGPLSYIYSLITLLATCFLSNLILAKLFKAPVNTESNFITALILFFMMFPAVTLFDFWTIVLAGIVAMASKYILAINKKHIFNPAGFAGVVLGLFGNSNVTWWVGSKVMLPLVLIFGILILRKIRRFQMFIYFLGATVITMILVQIAHTNTDNLFNILTQNFLSYPIIFFGTIMLTEPLTAPPTTKLRAMYGALAGILLSTPLQFGSLYQTPELSLILANIFSYFASLKKRLILVLKEKKEIAKEIYEFSFGNRVGEKAIDLGDLPGQYLEWTLPHQNEDSRGVRRYFSIASGFEEEYLKIGVKIIDSSSSFKKKLLSMDAGDEIAVGALAGDFLLPKDKNKKIIFIAGGIGVTPFRSMLKYLINEGEKRDVVLFYAVKSEEEIAYKDILDQVKTHYVVGEFITEKMIREKVPDFEIRLFYISGPNSMVDNYKKLLKKMGVRNKNIITDYFPGY